MQSTSFNFLANLTNGNNNTTKTDASVTSNIFTSKPASNNSEANLGTSAPPFKKAFGMPSSQTSTLFGSSNTSATISPFTSKADSTVKDSPCKTNFVSSSGDTSNVEVTKVTNANTMIMTPQVTTSIFGTLNTTPNKTVSSTTSSSPFKTQHTLNNSTGANATLASSSISDAVKNKDCKDDGKTEDSKMVYYSKLKGLNESVSDWIKKHVDETPLCILTPIFRDYEKYLKEIQAEYESSDKKNTNDKPQDKPNPEPIKSTESMTLSKSTSIFANASNSFPKTSPFKADNSKQSLFAPSVDNVVGQKPTGFSFGINNSSVKSPVLPVTASTGFSFGVQQSIKPNTPTTSLQTNVTTSTPLPITSNTNANSATPFSFSNNKPFAFGSNVSGPINNTENKNDNNDVQENEDTPPKVEFTPIAEENSVFDKRCKIFVKKDDNFVDKGVGTLYIKKIEGSDKHQLLVRANTSLGNVLLNLRLSSAIPTQKMGKNNVMIVCIPTPDSKPPPTSVLIRVKTSEEADELLEVLNKHKT